MGWRRVLKAGERRSRSSEIVNPGALPGIAKDPDDSALAGPGGLVKGSIVQVQSICKVQGDPRGDFTRPRADPNVG